jgi:hypothetical protein
MTSHHIRAECDAISYPRTECDATPCPWTECDATSYSQTEYDATSYTRTEYDAASHPRRRECACESSEKNRMWGFVTFQNNGMWRSVTSQNNVMLPSALSSSLNMRDKVSHSYKTTGKIYSSVCSNLYIFRYETARQITLARTAVGN